MPSLNTGNAILSNPIKVDSSYNVGIGGAASGSFKLNVTGTTNLTGDLTGTSAIFRVSSDRNLATRFDSNITLSAQSDSGAPESLRVYADTFRLFTATTAVGLTERLTIGNTGAATYAGTFRINTPNRSFFITSNAYSISDGVLSSGIGMDGDGLYLGNVTSSTGWTIANPQVTIRSSGNVGIGRTDPSFILDVNDTNASGARGVRISTSSSAAGPALFLYINSGSQTNWLVGNSYEVGNVLEFRSSNSFGGNPGTAGTSRMLITNTGNVTIATARTSGANVNAITLSDNVTGVQTSGFGVRILATSNNGQAKSAIGFEADGGTNNDTAIAFYTQTNAASLDRRMTINRNGNVLINTTADYGFKFVGSPTGDSFLGNTMQISAGDFGGTERQGAFGVAEWANVSTATINLASIFPRINFTSRSLSVLFQITNASTTTTMCSCLVLFGRTIGGTWQSSIISNININGLALSSASGSGTTITLNFGTATFGSAMITILNRA